MRKQTGLRNRFRSGRGQYSIKRKAQYADRYGAWSGGKQIRSEMVNGRTLVIEHKDEEN